MISFAPQEEERLLADTARSFAQKYLRPRLRAHEEARAVSDEVRAAFHALGLVGMELPEALGFGGLSLVARALVEEELAAGDVGAAFALDATGLAGRLIAALGTTEQKARWLSPFADQPLRTAACALSEAGRGPELSCTAVRDGDQWRLSGEKRFVRGAAGGQLFVILAREGLFVLEGRAGVTAVEDRDVLGIAELPPCTVRFDATIVERLGEGDWRTALRPLLLAQAAVDAARAVGCSRAALEVALRYAEERQAFGKPIGHFQSIAFLLADMATELDGARAMVWRGCREHDLQSGDAGERLAQAVVQAREAAWFITSNAVQILGGAGYVQDHPVEKWMRDARALAQNALPTEAAQARLISWRTGAPLEDADELAFIGAQPVSS